MSPPRCLRWRWLDVYVPRSVQCVRRLNDAEMKYGTYDRELVGLKEAVLHFQYAQGSSRLESRLHSMVST